MEDYSYLLSKNRVIWMMTSIQDAFDIPSSSSNNMVADVFKENIVLINDFLSGKSQPKLIFYYQPVTSNDEYETDGIVTDNKLFIASGEAEKLERKAVFFLRTVDTAVSENDIDGNVLFGEINPNALQQIKMVIGNVFETLIRNMDEKSWGECDDEQKKDFLQVYSKFNDEMGSGLKSLTNSMENYRIDKRSLEEAKAENRENKFYEELFEGWLDDYENDLKTTETTTNNEDGPETELIFWREKLQSLTILSELTKSNKEFCHVKNSVCNQKNQKGDDAASTLCSRYKELENQLTEKLNEAKDNVKYLVTLEKFIEPLKTGTPEEIIETLPALMNAIKMIHTIARHYKTSQKLTNLFVKITNQMINNCKNRIFDCAHGERVSQADLQKRIWERDPEELIKILESCMKLAHKYRKQYDETKAKSAEYPRSRNWDFDDNTIFGRFDKFIKRIKKLREIFNVIKQFKALEKHNNLEGMDELLEDFNQRIENFKNKTSDILDIDKQNFDKNYVDLIQEIQKLDEKLTKFIERNFSKFKIISYSLKLLRKLQMILKSNSIKNKLESKYETILQNYGSEIEGIVKRFDEDKARPPIIRNMPPDAGKIIWVRHLFAKLNGPIEEFPKNMIQHKDMKRYIDRFNLVGKNLIVYELYFTQSWCNEIEKAKAKLQAPLLFQSESNSQKKIHVNFEKDIQKLIREAKALDREGLGGIPESAKIILLQEEKFKNYYYELDFIKNEYERVLGMIKPVMKNILSAHIEDLDFKLRPGIVTLTWTSMNIDGFLFSVQQSLNRLEQLIITINDIIDNRIENNLKTISKVLLVRLPQDGKPMSLNSFVEEQKRHIEKQAEFLMSKNIEIERAVDDLLQTVMKYPLDQHVSEGVDQKAAKTIKGYYFWYLYHALLKSTQTSLNAMKNRVCGKSSADKSQNLRPFFVVDVKLEGGEVSLDPSLEDIKKAINRAATEVLSCSKKLLRWDQINSKDREMIKKKDSFYKTVAKDKEIVKVILLLTGSIEGTKKRVDEFKKEFIQFSWLWKDDMQKSLIEFNSRKPSPQLQDYEDKLKDFQTNERMIENIMRTKEIGAMSFKTDLLIDDLKKQCNNWKTEYCKNLHHKARDDLLMQTDRIKNLDARLEKPVDNIQSLGEVMSGLTDIRYEQAEIDMKFNPILDMYSLLEQHLQNLLTDREEIELKNTLRQKWDDLVIKSQEKQKELQGQQGKFLKQLKESIRKLVVDVKEFKQNFEERGPKVKGITPKEASDRLAHSANDFEVKNTFFVTNKKGEELFGLHNQQYPELFEIKSDIEFLNKLYELYNRVNQSTSEWEEKPWSATDVGLLNDWEEIIGKYNEQCNKLPGPLKTWLAFKELKKKIEEYRDILPLIRELKAPNIKDRHWEAIKDLMRGGDPNKEVNLNYKDPDALSFKDLVDIKILTFKDDYEDVISTAKKQQKIEKNKNEIIGRWENMKFEFKPWGAKSIQILKGDKIEIINETLEEDIGTLAGLGAMKQVTPFKDEVQLWQRTLGEIEKVVGLWVKVQNLWTSLESVFTQGDIANHLKAETKKFKKIDKDWKKIVMEKAVDMLYVKTCCMSDIIKETLFDLQKGLEECQKELNKYLEKKRKAFPRFYFVSDDVLLKFLSQGSEPKNIQDDFDKLFDSVAGVTFQDLSKKDKKTQKIIEIKESLGEAELDQEPIELINPVVCQGNIEDWLRELEKQMQATVRDLISRCYNTFIDNASTMDLLTMINSTCGQVALMAVQLRWTKLIDDALRLSGPSVSQNLKLAKEEIRKILESLTEVCKTELGSKLIRVKYETIVTISVYLNQVIQYKIKTKDVNSFDWQKYTRLYIKKSDCIISITDWNATHSYEYLGIKMRLCITPLTDRCYITLAQAMSMHYGGAPAGPAGTGKTETVKDMGRTLGIFVVVTNCGGEHRSTDMAKIFKGLCQSGLWGCFDEFNRIDLEVLSVVAMQVESITTAKRTNAKFFKFPDDDDDIGLILTCGYFITMNPGYAGRQELPENLKVLFRGVTMMVPNREIIIQVTLASSGYSKFELLAAKFNVLYALCEQQLSKQKHYDFGLRNILSVLRTAGKTLRTSGGTKDDEEMLIARTLKDMNLSKLVAQDVPLFMNLLADTFPGIMITPLKYDEEDTVRQTVTDLELTPFERWIPKIIQVFESNNVRHGNMIIGPVGVGKSALLEVLSKALSTTTGQKHMIHRLNPKSFTSKEMFGVKNISGEWTKGIFSEIWRKVNKKENKYINWIVCDGPVDAIWIESLNTVLDDNKVLTLANGDRIAMRPSCKMWFEAENLNNASPATVSRCGQIYISEEDLGYMPIIEAWVKQRTKDEKNGGKRDLDDIDVSPGVEDLFTPTSADIVMKILNYYFNDLKVIEAVEKIVEQNPIMETAKVLKATMTLNLLNGILYKNIYLRGKSKGVSFEKEDYEKIILYCVIWACAAVYEPKERIEFQEWLKESGCDIPKIKEGENIFDYEIDVASTGKTSWIKIEPEIWVPPPVINFSQILLPTIDSTRAITIYKYIANQSYSTISRKSTLVIGSSGTAKTSSVLMYAKGFDQSKMLLHRINFSSATQPVHFQTSIQSVCEQKIQKGFGPKEFKIMTVFIDDFSMPEKNEWGDQITLEIIRQLLEDQGFYDLNKNERGRFIDIENLQYIGAMSHPGGGRNDIPNRLKRQFFIINMILPERIDLIFNPILKQVFKESQYSEEVNYVVDNLADATIKLWKKVKSNMLPTPSKFHYIFNLRDVSRIFKGMCKIQKGSIDNCRMFKNHGFEMTSELYIIALWRHECERVFVDKLTDNIEKEQVIEYIRECSYHNFNNFEKGIKDFIDPHNIYYLDWLEGDKYDDDQVTILEQAEKIYNGTPDIEFIRKRCKMELNYYNEKYKTKSMDLVFFDEALSHLIRISRIIQTPRSSALLVGVGGSGKQSLTRLSAFTGHQSIKQIVLSKGFGLAQLQEFIKDLFDEAGHKGNSVTFIMTDAEVKEEEFLEYINMILSTGEIPGLLAKDDKEVWLGDVRTYYTKYVMEKKKGAEEPSQQEIYDYFVNRLRDNLHVVLCFSPIGTKFRERARKFPALFAECTIDWFLEWPKEALFTVAKQQIELFPELKTKKEIKEKDLPDWMSQNHTQIIEICGDYYQKFRREVFVTPKSYLFFLKAYKSLYKTKYEKLEESERNFKVGLQKIKEAKEDIRKLEAELSIKNAEITKQRVELDKVVAELKKKAANVEQIEKKLTAEKEQIEGEAKIIGENKATCEMELAEALPALEAAALAASKIDSGMISEFSGFKKKPSAESNVVVKIVIDALCILFYDQLDQTNPVSWEDGLKASKSDTETFPFIKDSFDTNKGILSNISKEVLQKMAKEENSDMVNDELLELLEPYINIFNDRIGDKVANNVSKAVAVLREYIMQINQFSLNTRVVKPKRAALAIQEQKLEAANADLEIKDKDLQVIKAEKEVLERNFNEKKKEADAKEEEAKAQEYKINKANNLITSLADEETRWSSDADNLAMLKDALVGSVAVATAFISYCGPFKSEFRDMIAEDYMIRGLKELNIPFSSDIYTKLTNFLVDEATVSQWNLDGLPKDNLSIQNGIMVDTSDRYPLLIDPQMQGSTWIRNRYEKMNKEDDFSQVIIMSVNEQKRFRDNLVKAIEDGFVLIIEGVVSEVDPILDPVLEKQYIIKSSGGKKIVLGDDSYDINPDFKLFLTCKLGNPKFTPELSAKTTVIDFTVTRKGLEQQLLSNVLSKEMKPLEDSLTNLLKNVTEKKKKLAEIDETLLQKLNSVTGNLIDDDELVEILGRAKNEAKDIQEQLADAEIKTKEINEKRDIYKPVAIRGSVLYFCVIEIATINWMYNSSLGQFLILYDNSIKESEPNPHNTKQRVQNILKYMTYEVFAYVNRGLFGKDKITFLLMVCFKIMITNEVITENDVSIFLKAGALVDKNSTNKVKPSGEWFPGNKDVWPNILALSQHKFANQGRPFFKDLPDMISGSGSNGGEWEAFFNNNDMKKLVIPDYGDSLVNEKELGDFMRFCLVRCAMPDKSIIASQDYILRVLEDEKFVEPPPEDTEFIWGLSSKTEPILFLLSAGADPTGAVDDLAQSKKKKIVKISLGEGQEVKAIRYIHEAVEVGSWVLLQNCHLGLGMMQILDDMLSDEAWAANIHNEFRVWITCEPREGFPLGLLQRSLKVTTEPPKGVKQGLLRTFKTVITPEFLEKIDHSIWRSLVYTMSFLHSVVQERRKFGPLGWCVPYEYNYSDLEASLQFIEDYLNKVLDSQGGAITNQTPPISYDVIKYMVCQIQYGGKIFDNLDRELFQAYGEAFIKDNLSSANSEYKFVDGVKEGVKFPYILPRGMEHRTFVDYINTFPGVDSPEVFKLHPNADITCRLKETKEMIDALMETRPKEGSGGGESREEKVKNIAKSFLPKITYSYPDKKIIKYVKDLLGPKGYPDNEKGKGDEVPLNIFLMQELQRMENIIRIVKKTFNDIISAINGQIIMTPIIVDAIDAIYDMRVPNHWLYDSAKAEISWHKPNFNIWFASFLERNEKLEDWMKGTRPKFFNLDNFFNPQGFLTSMKQEVVRIKKNKPKTNKNENWSMDAVEYKIVVQKSKDMKDGDMKKASSEGVYIEGLSIEGADIDKEGNLKEASGKKLIYDMPIVYVTAESRGGPKKSEEKKDSDYDCPVYKYPKRTDFYIIFRIPLKGNSSNSHADLSHWKLRGVAILCSID